MRVRGKRLISVWITAALLLMFLMLLMPKYAAYAENDGIDLIENPSIPVIVFHIDETKGTIDEMNADEDHNTECLGTMDIIVPDGFEGYAGMDTVPQTKKGIPLKA